MTAVAAVLLALAATSLSPANVVVSVIPGSARSAEAPVDARVTVRATPVGGRNFVAGDAVEASVKIPGTVQLALKRDVLWRFEVVADRWWCATTTRLVDTDRIAVPIAVWPAATVVGTLVAPEGENAPDTVVVSFAPPFKIERSANRGFAVVPGGDPIGEVPCPVKDGVFRCKVPAETLDLKVRCRGFVTIVRFAEPLAVGTMRDLGTLKLVPGATVVGWVKTADGPVDPARCVVRIAPALGGVPGSAEQQTRWRALAQTMHPTDRGGFTFEGLAAGEYTVAATHPGYVTVKSGRIVVTPKSDLEVKDALVLERPLSLTVTIVPARDPHGQRWHVALLRESDVPQVLDTLFNGDTGEDGVVTTGPLPPGKVLVQVWDSAHVRVAGRTHELTAAMTELTVKIERVNVSGIVRLGKRPLAAKVYFGRRFGAVSIEMESGADGRFEGVIPRDGKWEVQVTSEDPAVDHVLRSVDLTADKESHQAEVELALADGRVSGTVVDEDGAGVGGARISFLDMNAMTLSPFTSRAGGRFEIAGLAAGTYSLSAGDETPEGPRESPTSHVTVTDDGGAREVRLVLLRKRHVKGIVLGDGNPVPGARVTAHGDLRHGIFLASEDVVTDASGAFELALSAESSTLLAYALAPGFALKAFAIELTEGGERVTLNVSSVGGEVALVLPEAPRPRDPKGPMWLVWQDGVVVDSWLLELWAMQYQGRHGAAATNPVFPRVAPGNYRACWFADRDELIASAIQPPARGGPCVEGYLAPTGALRLDLSRFKATKEQKQ